MSTFGDHPRARSRTRLQAALVGITVVLCAAGAVPLTIGPASGATNRSPAAAMTTRAAPSIAGFAASSIYVAASGGPDTLTAKVAAAKTCTISASPKVAGLPATVSCSKVSKKVVLPKDTGAKAIAYDFTLTAKGTSTVTSTVFAFVKSTKPVPAIVHLTGSISTTTTPLAPVLARTYVLENVVVPAHKTLWVMPGTILKASTATSCSSFAANLCVLGTLVAVGTTSQRIVFTSINDDSVGASTSTGAPEAGDWYGIGITPGSTTTIDDASINYATDAIFEAASSAASYRLTANDDTFKTESDTSISLSGDESVTPIIQGDSTTNTTSGDATYKVDSDAINFNDLSSNRSSGSGANAFEVDGGAVTSTMTDQPASWLLDYLYVPVAATLTVAPGTVVKDSASGNACSGYDANLCVLGTLDAVGTSSQRIDFTSVNDDAVGSSTSSGAPAAGDWFGIGVAPGSTTTIDYATIGFASYAIFAEASSSASFRLTADNDSFSTEGDSSIYLNGNDTSVTPVIKDDATTNTAASDLPSYLVYSKALNFNDLLGNSSTGGGLNSFEVDAGVVTSTVTAQAASWSLDYVYVPVGVTLTIDPGTVLKSNGTGNSCSGFAADLCVLGTLDAEGSASQPITFTSINDGSVGSSTSQASPSAGDWYGIGISPGSTTTLTFANVDYADYAIFEDESSSNAFKLTATDDTFAEEDYASIFLPGEDTSVTPVIERDVTTSTSDASLSTYVVYSDALNFNDLSANSSTGAGSNAFEVDGTAVASTITAQAASWDLDSLSVPTGVTVSIDPGTVLKSAGIYAQGNDCADVVDLCVDGTLTAPGTAGSPIVFTSLNDDSVGSVTGDGSPQADDWYGIEAGSGGTITFAHVTVQYEDTEVL